MNKNFKLTIEYDGGRYHGWQRQPNAPTIQEYIETALNKMTDDNITLTGSGRTDAGVHAFGQTANFLCDTRLNSEAFHNGLNSLLPDDIVIINCERVSDDFHARFNSKSKIYQYRILNQNLPTAINRQYAWFIKRKLNLSSMKHASEHLIGSHDFKAFEGTGSPRAHAIRNITKAELTAQDYYVYFNIEADGFLRYMVRNIIGTLAEVGLGKTTVEDFKQILASKDRSRAGATAPPHGLFLVEVKY